ncbi:SUKH-3 domain-containing protein [Massilia pseudoviolaceinigra]|uniref:SUKH-3 domain-containing protein n=1 Tax=Massilia pseudoviolaceinigra TaxID=3057165 RepID=UPI002796585A|nr:SUKH-3 domain-containing protein [Massilia sp. CCM 9206]MDQ1920062.1 SUKH-3 domain-containing protein [Massilia sp. CCM 9206]
MTYSDQTLAILHDAGWTEERRVPADALRERLAAAGFVPHPAALAFLTRFEGLGFTHPSSKYEDGKNTCHFDLDRVIGQVDVDDIDDFSASVGTRLCPVGEINRGNSIVAIGEDGRVFSYYSPFIALQTRTVDEAIAHFLSEGKAIATRAYDGNPLSFA